MLNIPQYAAIWDVDGTLVDTAEMHFAAWLRLCRELGRPFSREDFAATFGKRNPEIFRQLLTELHAAGVRQAIGSSAPRGNVDLILALTETEAFFQAISSAEDTTRGKPDPQVFLVAADRLKVAPAHCVVFEDAVAGVEAARAG